MLWQDNYLSLLPGEKRTVTATFRAQDLGGGLAARGRAERAQPGTLTRSNVADAGVKEADLTPDLRRRRGGLGRGRGHGGLRADRPRASTC